MTEVYGIGVGRADVCGPEERPRLRWKMRGEERDWVQSAAEVRWRAPGGAEASRILDGPASVDVEWPFGRVGVTGTHTLAVRVRGRGGRWSAWSPEHRFAVTVGFGDEPPPLVGASAPASAAQPLAVRSSFHLPGDVETVTMTLAAQGSYVARVNGRRVTDQELTGGWPAFQARLIGDEFDVSDLCRPGENHIGLHVAGTWFTEAYGHLGDTTRFYGEQPAVAIRVTATRADGSRLRFDTGPDWEAATGGPVRSSSLYQGEVVDLRREDPRWDTPDGAPEWGWAPVACFPAPPRVDIRDFPPVRRIGEIEPVEHWIREDGRVVIDFGQNHAGRLRLRIDGERGDVITLRHAEVLEHGELAVRPLRHAAATDEFVLPGGPVTVEPSFTFHGYRYAEISGLREGFDPSWVVSVVLGSALEPTGTFACSDPLIQRLHENVVWSTRSNFLAIPTDCPQRDERLGWTGDIGVFAATGSFLVDDDAFLQSWLVDLAIEQDARGGRVPVIVPDPINDIRTPAAAWGDAATIVPWALYERFGDTAVLERQLPSMKAWVEVVNARTVDGIWAGDFQFGDWLDPTAPPDQPGLAVTDPDLVATAYLYRSARITADVCALVGDADHDRFSRLAESTAAAFRARFAVGELLSSDTVTAYALAIQFDLARDADARAAYGNRLAALVRAHDHRIATGFVGTPLVCDALTASGFADVAEALLFQTQLPSWLYPVTQGATTIWERWDSLLPDGTVNPGEMTSFNHYALGAIADWMHRRLGGLAPAAPGYARIEVAPLYARRLEHASASLESVHGRIATGWARRPDGQIDLWAEIPPNTSGRVRLGDGAHVVVGSGVHRWVVPDPVAPRSALHSHAEA
jgi:alpha-L-rhamnosidase